MKMKWLEKQFPSPVVLKIVKATEMVFKQRVLDEERGVNYEYKLDLKIQSAVLELLGPQIFKNISGHYFEHSTGAESDQLSSVLRLTVQKYLGFWLKTYGKEYSEMVIHSNVLSIRHTLTKSVIFKNQWSFMKLNNNNV